MRAGAWAVPVALVLAGCMPAGEGGGLSFLTSKDEKKAAAPRRDLPKSVVLAGGRVTVNAPRGYCVDPATVRRGSTSGFALLGACNTLRGDFAGADVEPVVMTISVQPRLLKQDAPTAEAMAAVLAPRRALRKENGDGLTLIQLADGGDQVLPAGDPKHWRGAMLVNGYLIGLALYAPKGSAYAEGRGRRLLLALAENLRAANTKVRVQAAKKPG